MRNSRRSNTTDSFTLTGSHACVVVCSSPQLNPSAFDRSVKAMEVTQRSKTGPLTKNLADMWVIPRLTVGLSCAPFYGWCGSRAVNTSSQKVNGLLVTARLIPQERRYFRRHRHFRRLPPLRQRHRPHAFTARKQQTHQNHYQLCTNHPKLLRCHGWVRCACKLVVNRGRR